MDLLSDILKILSLKQWNYRLNPCFSGLALWRWEMKGYKGFPISVLILVLVDLLSDFSHDFETGRITTVLILVLVDLLSDWKNIEGEAKTLVVLILVLVDLLSDAKKHCWRQFLTCSLNPCFSGLALWRKFVDGFGLCYPVLILVLVDLLSDINGFGLCYTPIWGS